MCEGSNCNTVMVGSMYLKLGTFERQIANIIYGISDRRGSCNVETPKTSVVSQAEVASVDILW